MSENNGGGRELAPFGSPIHVDSLVKDLTGFELKVGGAKTDDAEFSTTLRKLYLTLSNFTDRREADSFARTIAKGIKHRNWSLVQEVIMIAMGRTSIKGEGRKQLVEIFTQIMQETENARQTDERRSARKPGQVTT